MADLRVRQQGLADEFGSGSQAVRSLGATASTADRIEAILELLSVEELAAALDVTASTIRNWMGGQATPRRPALRTLDDLRRTILLLVDAGIQGEDCAQWLRSRQGGALENDRPVDVVATDPLRVLAAAAGMVIKAQESEPGGLRPVSG